MAIKRFFKIVWQEFVYGGHLLPLGAEGIIIATILLLNEKLSWDYPLIIYLVAYVSYLYNRYKEINKDILTNPERTQHFKKYAKFTLLIISCIFLILLGILIYSKKVFFLPFLLLLFFGGLFYTFYFKKLTKKIAGFKNFYVATEWTLPIALLPIYYSFSFSFSLCLIIILVYLKTFIINSYFDIKDIESDQKENLLTFPVIIGVKKCLFFLKTLTLLFSLIVILGIWSKLLPLSAFFLFLTIPFNFYIFKQTEKKIISFSKLYFLAGSEFVFWPVLVLIGNFIL